MMGGMREIRKRNSHARCIPAPRRTSRARARLAERSNMKKRRSKNIIDDGITKKIDPIGCTMKTPGDGKLYAQGPAPHADGHHCRDSNE